MRPSNDRQSPRPGANGVEGHDPGIDSVYRFLTYSLSLPERALRSSTAIVSDVAYGSKVYLHELSNELRKQGIVDERSTINGVQDLLDAIGKASGVTAQSLDLPPLSVEGIRKSLSETIQAVAQIDVTKALPQSEIDRLWQVMKQVSEQQHVALFQIGSAMTMYSINQITKVGKGAATGVQVARSLLDRTIVEHYRQGLDTISRKGFYQFLLSSSQPYFDAVWNNFSSMRPTATEDILQGRLAARLWNTVRQA